MNVASLELCKELDRLTGWNDTEKVWRDHLPLNKGAVMSRLDMEADNFRFRADTEPNRRFREENKFYAAYDLGYLLRKLPARIGRTELHVVNDGDTDYCWTVGYMMSGSLEDQLIWSIHTAVDDTPENAACKLVIELIEEGAIDASKR